MEENNLITKISSYFFIIVYIIGFISNVLSKNWLFAGIWGVLVIVNLSLMILRKNKEKKE